MQLIFLTLSSLLAAAAALGPAPPAGPQVKIGLSTLIGRTISSSVEFFGGARLSSLLQHARIQTDDIPSHSGIPFAEPPVGLLRFRDPILRLIPHGLVIDAKDFGPFCIQPVRTVAS